MSYNIQRVRVIAYLFVVLGTVSWLQFIVLYWADGSLVAGTEMILLPAGLGLLRRSEAWRRISVGLIGLGMILVIAVPVLGYTISPVFHVRIHGMDLDPTSASAIVFVVGYLGLLLVCLFWLALALRDESVRRFFSDAE